MMAMFLHPSNSGSTTARNLCGIEWQAQRKTGTVAEFTTHWNSLTPQQREPFVSRSKLADTVSLSFFGDIIILFDCRLRQPLPNLQLAVPAHNSPAFISPSFASSRCIFICAWHSFHLLLLSLSLAYSHLLSLSLSFAYSRLLSALAFSRYQYPTHALLFCTPLDLHYILLPFCMPTHCINCIDLYATANHAAPPPPTF